MLTNIHCVLLSLISGYHARLFLLVAVSLLLCLLSMKGYLMSITLEYLLPGGAWVLYLPLQGTRLNRWLAHQLELYLFSSQWNRLPNPENSSPRKPTDSWSFVLYAIREAQMPTARFLDDLTFATNGYHLDLLLLT